MAYSYFLSLGLCVLVLLHSSVAQIEQVTSRSSGQEKSQRQQRWQRDECQLNRINAVEPSRRFQSEAGLTEIWDENDQQFQCVGVVAMRHNNNAGRGIQGAVIPGCPETYQAPSQLQFTAGAEHESQRDQHQKVRQIQEGDVIALPAGVAQWIYNNGRSPLVLVQIIDTSNPISSVIVNQQQIHLRNPFHKRPTANEGVTMELKKNAELNYVMADLGKITRSINNCIMIKTARVAVHGGRRQGGEGRLRI